MDDESDLPPKTETSRPGLRIYTPPGTSSATTGSEQQRPTLRAYASSDTAHTQSSPVVQSSEKLWRGLRMYTPPQGADADQPTTPPLRRGVRIYSSTENTSNPTTEPPRSDLRVYSPSEEMAPEDSPSAKTAPPPRRRPRIYTPPTTSEPDESSTTKTEAQAPRAELGIFTPSTDTPSDKQGPIRIGGSEVDSVKYKDEIIINVENTPAGREALGLIDFALSGLLEHEPQAHTPEVRGDTQLRIVFTDGTSQKKVGQVKKEIDAQLQHLAASFPTFDDLMKEKSIVHNEGFCKGMEATGHYLDVVVDRLEQDGTKVTPKDQIALRNVLAEHWVKHRGTSSDTQEAYNQVIVDHLISQMPASSPVDGEKPFVRALAARQATPYAAAAVNYANENELNITFTEAVGLHKALRDAFVQHHPEKTATKEALSDMYADAAVAYFKTAKIDYSIGDDELRAGLKEALLKTAKKIQAEARRDHS